MKLVIVVVAAMIASGCIAPKLTYLVREYGYGPVTWHEIDGYRIRIEDHQTEPKLTAAQHSWKSGAYDDGGEFRTTQAVQMHIGPACSILEKRALGKPTWEYLYHCN